MKYIVYKRSNEYLTLIILGLYIIRLMIYKCFWTEMQDYSNVLFAICIYSRILVGPSWSYGIWIYNYLCISQLKLWVQISGMARGARYNIRW
jgi:hypothetical protein